MMTLYAVCAVLGGVFLVMQFLLSLIGLGQDSDMVDGGHGDVGHGGGGDVHHGDMGHGDTVDAHAYDGDATDHAQAEHHDSTWFFRLVSFRSMVAALAFFGIGGGLGESAGFPFVLTFVLAVTTGVLAMLLVAWLMHLLMSLHEEGTVRIGNVLGQTANVYLKIPGHESGVGKVTVMVQNRTMEYEAMTEEDELPTGSRVVITDIVNESTVKVKREQE